MKICNLQVNHLTEPVGIPGENIRLTWTLEGGKYQTAFQVTATDKDGHVLEDSGKVVSREMVYRLHKALPPRAVVRIAVTAWDENDAPAESAITVVTGIEKTAWKAKWINPELKTDPKVMKPASYLKKTFIVDRTEEAWLYITSHGIFNAWINGKEISPNQLMPGTSQIDKRLMVQTIPVSEYLREGENEILVSLGDGWYRGSMGFDQIKNMFGTDVSLLCQLELGGKPVLISDESWWASQNGPLGLNDMMAGEEYDARKEQITDWHGVKIENFGYSNLIGVDNVPMRRKEKFAAKLITTPAGEKVLDFGQNFAGYVELDITAKAGDEIILTHGETLDKDGNFTIENFQARKCRTEQRVHYICKDGRNTYHPTKCYFGFRYVKVETSLPIDGSEFTGIAVYSDMRQTGFFECGVQEVNQLFSNALWSMKSNFVDVPTDCPQREKSGYSGDCQAYIRTAVYLMDCYSVYAKWIREQAATQGKDGFIRQVAPYAGKRHYADAGAAWCDSLEIVPYYLWKAYNDPALGEEIYENMKAWIGYELKKASKTRFSNRKLLPKELKPYLLDKGFLWGEWLEPGSDVVAYTRDIMFHGDPEVGTAYLYHGCCILKEFAQLLGKTEDAAFFADAAEKAKQAYRYVYTENGMVKDSLRQCRYVRPIALELLNENEKKANAAVLAQKIKDNGNKLNTGFLTTNQLCRVLTEQGQTETAYDLLLQRECPGWLYPVSKGATTIWETWDGIKEDGTCYNSFNHYSYGAIVGWLIECACGIRVSDGKITIQPHPDKRLGHAGAVYDSPFGAIKSAWKYDEDALEIKVTVPCNGEADVILPNGENHHLTAGEYVFTC